LKKELTMIRWKSVIWMATGMAALSLVGAFTAKPLLAQIKAAFVENVDEPGRNPFHVTKYFGLLSAGFQCDSNDLCTAFYGVVPAGKRLIVTHVSGLIFCATPGVVAYAEIYDSTSGNPLSFTYMPTVLQTGTVSGSNMIGVNAPVLAYFNPGDQPTIVFQTTTAVSNPGALPPSGITVSGYYVNLP
jgi:hypothetical protein